MLKPWIVGLCCAVSVASLGGCFESSTLQASFESSSKSSQASFESSSKLSSSCSGSDSEESAYQRDIRDYTTTYAASGGDPARFQRDLGAIAESHGVTDWEADPVTLVAVGRGLERSRVDAWRTQQLEAVVTHGDSERTAWIRKGYECRPE